MSPIRMNSQTASVKVIVTMGGVERTYDIPLVEDFKIETIYDPPPRFGGIDDARPSRCMSVAFSMAPLSDSEGKCMTITGGERHTEP